MKSTFKNIDEYITSFPADVLELLEQVRAIIEENAPGAMESISYGMPAFKLHNKPLVYFAGYENHIGFYATPTGHAEFAKELAGYKQGRGSVQFPLDKPIPFELIGRIVAYRVYENMTKLQKG